MIAVVRGDRHAGVVRRDAQPVADGEIDLLLGTHALIEDPVVFKDLALAVIDEQHRFGVRQRAALKEKAPEGAFPHILTMTATPIPRSLALTVFGELDVTTIDELPPGRQEIVTKVMINLQNVHGLKR